MPGSGDLSGEGAEHLDERLALGLGGIERARRNGPAVALACASLPRRAPRSTFPGWPASRSGLEESPAHASEPGGEIAGRGKLGASGEHPRRVAAQLGHAEAAELDAEVLGGHLLDGVGLVEDDGVVARQHGGSRVACAGSAEREIGEEEVVVHHHHVRLGGDLAHLEDEAVVVVRALLPGAGLRRRKHLAEGGEALGQIGELGPISRRRALRPFVELPVERGLLAALEGGGRFELLLAQQAQVVLPSLQEGEAGLDPEGAQQRDVLVGELLLQGLGGGRDDDLEPAPRRRNEIGEGLSRTGTRLDGEGPAPLERR